MANRIKLTDSEKQKLIYEHKGMYLTKKKIRINKQIPTVVIFDSLPFAEQWDRIYTTIIKPKELKKKEASTPFQEVKNSLKFITNKLDFLSTEQMDIVFELIVELKDYYAEEEKKTDAERRKIAERRKVLQKELEELDAMDKLLLTKLDIN